MGKTKAHIWSQVVLGAWTRERSQVVLKVVDIWTEQKMSLVGLTYRRGSRSMRIKLRKKRRNGCRRENYVCTLSVTLNRMIRHSQGSCLLRPVTPGLLHFASRRVLRGFAYSKTIRDTTHRLRSQNPLTYNPHATHISTTLHGASDSFWL